MTQIKYNYSAKYKYQSIYPSISILHYKFN